MLQCNLRLHSISRSGYYLPIPTSHVPGARIYIGLIQQLCLLIHLMLICIYLPKRFLQRFGKRHVKVLEASFFDKQNEQSPPRHGNWGKSGNCPHVMSLGEGQTQDSAPHTHLISIPFQCQWRSPGFTYLGLTL